MQPYDTVCLDDNTVPAQFAVFRCVSMQRYADVSVRGSGYVSSSATTSIQLLKISLSLFLTHFQSFRQSTTLSGIFLAENKIVKLVR